MKPTPFLLSAATAALFAALAPVQAATYEIDPNHANVMFEIDHFRTTTNRVRFDKTTGTIEFDREARSGKVDVNIDVNSLNHGAPDFVKHLKSPDFFDVAKYPIINFVSDQFQFRGDKVRSVKGKLTLLGKTHPVTLKADKFNCYQSPVLKAEVCGGDFETTIDRTAFGMNWGVEMGFPKNVHLIVQIEAVKK